MAEENGKDIAEVITDPVEEVVEGNSEEEEDEEEDSGDDSQQDEAVGTAAEGNVALLDKPLVVEGKRRKRSVNRLTAGKLVADAVPLEIEAGKGTPLGEIEEIVEAMTRPSSDDLRILHRLLFGVNAKKFEIKRHIRAFSGFPFDATDDRMEAKRVFLNKYQAQIAREICEYLCLMQSGTKLACIERILDFLLKPSAKLLTSVSKGATARRRSSSGGAKESDSKRSKSPKKASSRSTSPQKRSPSKATKTPTKSPAKASKTPTKSPKTVARKRKSPAAKATVTAFSSDDSSDEEPLSKKLKTPFPSDEDLEGSISAILKKSDMEVITVKAVLAEVCLQFKDHDLSAKKAFMKTVTKELYAAMNE